MTLTVRLGNIRSQLLMDIGITHRMDGPHKCFPSLPEGSNHLRYLSKYRFLSHSPGDLSFQV